MVQIYEDENRQLVETKFGSMHLWLRGESDVPVVLLHMSLSSGRMYRDFAKMLDPEFSSISPDRLGSGFSDHPPHQLTLEQYAECTIEALEKLGVNSFHVLGVHTGSCEAIELASKFPAHVQSVGLVTVPVFKPETISEYKASYLLEPEPDPDGDYLNWYWRWWKVGGFAGAAERSREWEPEIIHPHLVDHFLAQPNPWWTYHAVFDHDAGVLLKDLKQPVLVFDVPDDLIEETRYAQRYFPKQTKVVDLPSHNDVLGLFTTGASEIAHSYKEFLLNQN